MPELPTGTVTFLFTDIEGSTALWEQHHDAMRQALVRHDVLIERIVAEHHGHVVRPRGEGDSRFAVFARATNAVTAAAAVQQLLHAELWPTPTPLRVRIAVHTGEADLRDSDYYGSAVNRCARLRAVAHGGQTLVSLATEQVVRGQLISGLVLHDLGEHLLKDLQHSERVFQLIIDGVPADFPPLKTLDARASNLPLQPTSFIGREQEVAAVRQRLLDPQVRLLTMTGPGGTGKTRLALQVAAELLEDFSDGVWLVELAPTHDPALVTSAIAAILGVKESGAQPLIESLKLSLRGKHLLLLLDNFEQVLAAAPQVAELLSAAPALKVLVTSRARLQLRGEREVAVPPLSLPLLTALPSHLALEQVAAVRLFVERARDARADFVLTPANAPAVAEICVRLDGLPLAIELAAARSKMLAPQALLSRLDNRLKLLTGGARDLPTRQQTLRGTIDWSFSLLDANEQRLFTRLGVFVGGWTVEAAEAVCDADGDLGLDVLDGLQSLLDKSLLKQVEAADGGPRFRRLETIREYAVEQLAASGEAQDLQQRHAAYYLHLVETADLMIRRPGFQGWCDRLTSEHDNLRTALACALAEATSGETGLRLAAGLRWYWFARGHASEGRIWLERMLRRSGTSKEARAMGLCAFGVLAYLQGDYSFSGARLDASIALWRELAEPHGLAESVHLRGHVAFDQGNYQLARALFEESRAHYQMVGDTVNAVPLMKDLALVAGQQGDFAKARQLVEECLAYYQAEGIADGVADMLLHRGDVARLVGDYQHAGRLYEQSLAMLRELNNRPWIAEALHRLGFVAQLQGNQAQAKTHFSESLAIQCELGGKLYIGLCLVGLAGVASATRAGVPGVRRVATLVGAASGLLDAIGTILSPADRLEYERILASLQAQLDDATFAVAWAEGRTMTLEQAIAFALEEPDAGSR